MRDFHFYDTKHLGDCVFDIHFLRNLITCNPDIRVFYYFFVSRYAKELKKHIVGFETKIILNRVNKCPSSATCLWHASKPLLSGVIKNGRRRVFCLNDRYYEFYSLVCDSLNLNNPFSDKNGLLLNNESIIDPIPDFTEECDLLLINSIALSRQYFEKPNSFENFVLSLKDRYKIVCAKELRGIPCTLDYNMNLLQIGHLATKAKYVVGIATSPIIPAFNVWSIATVKKWAVLSNRSTYTYKNNIHRFIDISKIPLKFFDE